MNFKSSSIKLATSTEQIEQCFPIMSQLRSHFRLDDFIEQVQKQIKAGYQLAYIATDNEIVGVAGFNITASLSWGKYLYVADLAVDQNNRSRGYGQALFTWLLQYARDNNCQQFHLDSGVQRFTAHRFYLQQKMNITGHHFALEL